MLHVGDHSSLQYSTLKRSQVGSQWKKEWSIFGCHFKEGAISLWVFLNVNEGSSNGWISEWPFFAKWFNSSFWCRRCLWLCPSKFFYPDIWEKLSTREPLVGTAVCELHEVSNISSAYKNNLSWWPAVTHLIFELHLIAIARGSRTIVKRRGDSGHPCFVPLYKWNGEDIIPLHGTEAIYNLYIT